MADWAKGRQFLHMAYSLQALPALSRTALRPHSRGRALLFVLLAVIALALVFAAGNALFAQVEGERGIAPVASTGDIEVGGIKVDVTDKTGEEAREEGWKIAQREGWKKLGGPAIADSQLDSMVSAIVVEREQIGPNRYIATLGVIFDRTRAGALLGNNGPRAYSAPMLIVPVLDSGGTETVYEVRNSWQKAWAEFQTGASAINYVRPAGAGGESLLLTYGQTTRRSRTWWRNILDEFSASDVLVAIAKLERQWPGGPVRGTFTARYGPDNRYLGSFKLSAASEEAVPEMLNAALIRFDRIFAGALAQGKLRPDPTLAMDNVQLNPALVELLRQAREAQAQEALAPVVTTAAPTAPAAATQATSTFTVQFATPDAGAVDAAVAAVRGTPGVQGAATSSIALGGTSVMRVSFVGDLSALAAALKARGWQVTQGSNALSIRR